MNYVITALISLLILSSCNNQEINTRKHLNKSELLVLKNCINNVMSTELEYMNKSYIVNPYFNSFRFNNYIKNNYKFDNQIDNNKAILYKEFNWNDSIFKNIQNNVDKKYINNYYNINKLSISNSSNIVLTFSGISDNLIFLEIVNYCKEIDEQQLIKGVGEQRPKKEIYSLVFVLKNNNIEKVLVDETISFELQCNE